MRRIAASALLLSLLAGTFVQAGAAPRRGQGHLVTVYDCSETLQTADGELIAEPDSVRWHASLGDGIRLQMGLRLLTEEEANFAETGFANRFADEPRFVVEFDRRHAGPNFERVALGREQVAAELVIGNQALRQWMSGDMALSFNWRTVRELLQGEGDVRIRLYDLSGATLQRATLDRNAFARVERQLMLLHARVREKLVDRDNRCRVTQEWQHEVVVDD